MSINNSPTYNMKVVTKETGISAETLRAWERRYGLPMPERTPGGHRLYSQRDIEIVKWLMEKQREGLSISRAVDLWNELSASGEDPLPDPIPQILSAPGSSNLEDVRKQWLDACLTFNENAAEQFLNQAFALHPLETVCVEVLQRGLVEIGEKWYRNEATVQQEHFTSALAQRRLDTLILATPPPTRPQTILVGCTSKEQHTFTTSLLTLLLRRRGLIVVYLGANVPIQRFNETLHTVKPHLVILSAHLLQTVNGLRETAANLQASGARVAYGGRIFNVVPELRTRIPVHFLGESIQEAIQTVETLLTGDILLEGILPVSKQDQALSKSFIYHQSMIEMNALTEATRIGIPAEYSTIAIQQLGDNLVSALSLGYLAALDIEMDWTKGLLREHIQNDEDLNKFLTVYAKSVAAAMGKEGQAISAWLKSLTN